MFSNMLQRGMQAVGNASNGLAKAGGATPSYSGPNGDGTGDGTFGAAAGQGLMGLWNSLKARKSQGQAGTIGRAGPSLTQGGGIGQPGAQAGTLFGSMGPARSSQPSY